MNKHNSEYCLDCEKILDDNETIFPTTCMGCEEYICESCFEERVFTING